MQALRLGGETRISASASNELDLKGLGLCSSSFFYFIPSCTRAHARADVFCSLVLSRHSRPKASQIHMVGLQSGAQAHNDAELHVMRLFERQAAIRQLLLAVWCSRRLQSGAQRDLQAAKI